MSTLPTFEDHEAQVQKFTTCYMCACRCGIKVTLEQGKIRFIQGNHRHPVNEGVLCAKGNAGIMKQESPAKLRKPLRRKPGTARGDGEFEEIEWDEALDVLCQRLTAIRETDPKKLAFFTGRDQMQALTGLWASQFGTINWSAHGGFCSVNMAAAGLYTTGFSFWEFGDPDWERTKYFLLWGVAEDHSSNPIKLGLDKLKRRGGKFVAINPVRTGYQAIADEWIPIRPGTDGILALSMIHVLLDRELFDADFLVRYTNAAQLVITSPQDADHGLLYRDDNGQSLVFDSKTQQFADFFEPPAEPALFGEYPTPDGRRVKTVMTLIAERYLDDAYAPAKAAEVCGVDAQTIERLALEIAHVAFKETIEIACEWTDWAGRKHDKFVGRPVSMHAMRGIAAHSNGFQAARALHLLQALLGTVDVPGGHRAKAPYPKHVPPANKPARPVAPGEPLAGAPLGFPKGPEDLLVDDDGKPLRIDKAFSWEAPLAIHGMMHMVITNAVKGDPYPIDTLLLFMANMSWNSSMNTAQIRSYLRERDEDGQYKLPFVVVVDAFHSEMAGFADLVLPDTTYLERYDCISLLDRPISEPDSICDAIRQPVIDVDRDVRPWQDVMFELAVRLGFPAFVDAAGRPKYQDYRDFIARFERAPGVGFLAGWRGEDGAESIRGAPNPDQWERYIDNECFFQHKLAPNQRFYRFANRDYLSFAKEKGLNGSDDPIVIELYSETLQKFRLSGEGKYDGPRPNRPEDRERLVRYFDPLPFFYPPLENAHAEQNNYGFHAVTQRPMFMYHSWDSQNAWLRQISAQNFLYMNRKEGTRLGIEDESWVWLESRVGRVRAQVKFMEGVEERTVWTWNAIGKQRGAWGLTDDANESNQGFLLNHLISELQPADVAGAHGNSDPVTGQAAWYDLRVSIYPAEPEAVQTWPTFETLSRLPGRTRGHDSVLRYATHTPVRLSRTD